MVGKYLKGIGIFVGFIFGAGVFGLPFVISRAGIFWGIVHFIIAFTVVLLLHFLYSKIVYFTEGRHRFTGYVKLILGKNAEKAAIFFTITSYYGSLLVYGVLGGIFLYNLSGLGSLVPYEDSFFSIIFTLIFFIAGGLMILAGLDAIGTLNFYLIFPIFAFILYLFFLAVPSIDLSNFSFAFGARNVDWFLPYGVWFFALGGFAAIPETRDVLKGASFSKLKNVVLIGTILPAIFYWLFIIAIVGISGANTTQDAFKSEDFGKYITLFGSLVGFLAVFTSFLVLAEDLRNIWKYDFKKSGFFSWILTLAPPIFLFLIGVNSFIKTMGVMGTLGLGSAGFFIVFMNRKLRKKKDTNINGGKFNGFVELFIALAILFAVVFEINNLF